MTKNAPKGFDPSMIDECLDDLKALSAPVQKTVVDFLRLVTGKGAPMQAAKPVKCGPNGETDAQVCIDCAIECQVHALGVLLQVKGCQE